MQSVGNWLKENVSQRSPAVKNTQNTQANAAKQQQRHHRHRHKPHHQGPANIPQGGGRLRIYPLGGFEQVGRNCMVIEVDQDIFLIDLGLQFPDEDMLGIDYLIPDITSLQGKENRIRGILFTHGHLDHVGAVQHLLPKLHYPPCYGTKLTLAFVRKRLEEEHIANKAQLHTVEYNRKITFGQNSAEFLHVTHSIPDAAAIALHTPYGTLLHTGDFKFDFTPTSGDMPADFQGLADLGRRGVLAIIADSTNATKSGSSKSEAEISETLHRLIRDANGRVIISTFSSLLNRIQQIVDHAKQYNRKVFIAGRSMETNIEIAQNLGYLKAPRGLIRKVGPGMDKIPDRETLIIATGSQGEEMAGLARIGLGTHRHISIKTGDTVILSSNPIIGNERSVAKVINNLHLQGAIVKTSQELSLHTTGHGCRDDILLMHRLVQPKHIIPEHGEPYMRAAHAQIARDLGYTDDHIHQLSNGDVLEFDAQGNARKSKQKISVNDVIIDGKGSAGEGKRIMDDRKIMSKNGMIIVLFRAYTDSKRLVGNPDILSRGLIYGSEQEKITSEVVEIAKKAYQECLDRGENDRNALKRAVNGALYRYFDRKLDRQPMLVPVIVEV